MKSGRTRVYFTVDVECAEERGRGAHARPALGYDLRVWGRLSNQRDELGIVLIMNELEQHGARGSFFVESLGARSFGEQGLKDVCHALSSRGHDVQLHTHPIQRNATWRSRGEEPPLDDIGRYSIEEQSALLREGVDVLERCGIARSTLLAYRAGNFGASNDTWAAMQQAGLCLDSSYNPCYFAKNCKMRFGAAHSGLFATSQKGVWELPVTNFVEPGGTYRHLRITAVSLSEMTECLRQSRALGIGHVTIVTHSFEFFFLDDAAKRRGHLNRVNLERLRGLCRFLKEHDDEFEVNTVGQLAGRLRDEPDAEPASPPARPMPFPRGRRTQQLRRMVEQSYKRLAERARW